MFTRLIPPIALAVLAVGCDSQPPTGPEQPAPQMSAQGSPIVHRVSVGGPDAFGPGVDKNFSMVAIQRRDGSSTGQFTDQWNEGRGSIHVTVDCLKVIGNRAWVSGVVTGGTAEDMGQFILTMVQDNGTSQQDPPDQISYSFYTDGTLTCDMAPELPLLPMPKGQVKVQ